MIKVLIVDDDFLIRTNIKVMLDWEENSFTVCGEASNGVEALALIKNKVPDIIISDIRMPVMDGLQLSREVNNNFPNSKMIMLSSYDDYEYVRGTLKNGAIDYILKHNLSKEVLLNAITRAKEMLEEEDIKSKNSIKSSKSTNNILAIKEKFIIHLLTDFYKDENEVLLNIKALEMKIDTKNVLAVIMVIDDYKSVTVKGSLKDSTILEFAVINIADEILNDISNGVACHISNERFVILLSFAQNRSSAAIDSMLNSILDRIAVCLKNFMNISVSFSIGIICDRLINISKSYETADRALTDKFYAGKNCILKSSVANESKNFLYGLDIETERQIILNIKAGNWNGMYAKLEEVFACIKNEKINPSSSQMVFNDLLGIINRICKENNIALSVIYANISAPHELLASFETLDEIKAQLFDLFNRLIPLIDNGARESNSEYVNKALNYIKQHFTDNISLANVADEIKITNVYLSKLFKEEMNIGFSEYLCDLKLEKAKSLLVEGKHEIKDIAAMCGFNNYAYFFNTFKKKTGLTPKEFTYKKTGDV